MLFSGVLRSCLFWSDPLSVTVSRKSKSFLFLTGAVGFLEDRRIGEEGLLESLHRFGATLDLDRIGETGVGATSLRLQEIIGETFSFSGTCELLVRIGEIHSVILISGAGFGRSEQELLDSSSELSSSQSIF